MKNEWSFVWIFYAFFILYKNCFIKTIKITFHLETHCLKPLFERLSSLFLTAILQIKSSCLLKVQPNKLWLLVTIKFGSSRPDVFLVKGVLKIYNKYTGEHPCRSVISIKLLCNFIEIALRHGCSPVNLLHIFRTPFSRNTFGWLRLRKILN